MCRIMVAFVCLFLSNNLVAQFNDSVTHHISLSAAGNINRTNSGTTYLLNNEARFSIKNKRTSFNSMAGWVYGKSEARLTNNDFISTIDFNLFKNDSAKLYYWGLINYTTSFSLKINHQWQGGAGLAYNFINSPTAWLNVSDGLLYEASKLNTTATDDKYQTVRNSLRLSYNFIIKNRLTIYGSHFLQNSLQDKEDFIIRSNTNVKFQLNKWVSFTTGLTYNEVSRTQTQNLFVKYGLLAERFF